MSELPIEGIRGAFEGVVGRGAVVVSAPTGSGKSTQVPRWCRGRGPVLVVEPRRVACRSLAQRVAGLEGSALGAAVGYSVRDEHRARGDTEILFATPGIVLRMIADGGIGRFATIVVDEYHERGLDVDLILALLDGRRESLVVMSATLDGERVAGHLGGVHLRGEGRMYPVDVRYLPGDALLPEVRGLERRVVAALEAARGDPGDVLVFLPGKAEIASVGEAIRGRRDLGSLTVLELHGGLDLATQSRAFEPAPGRKVVLATNVAETSVTLPGIGVVIDAGLVRRTRYVAGRGYLTLLPIALDSAEQRAGRAGRTAPGVCYRLWSPAARLEARTPPEIHRESLVPLVLSAAACGVRRLDALSFLDPPKEHAVEAAVAELTALGVLDGAGRLTDRGRRLFDLPLDAHLGRLLVEAEGTPALEDVVDLVSVLAVGRPPFEPLGRGPLPEDDPRSCGCDATALIRAVRATGDRVRGIRPFVLREARAIRHRLRDAFGLPRNDRGRVAAPVDRERLARVALAADPRVAHVARRRRKAVAWSNGGTEVELSRDSAVQRALEEEHLPGAPKIEALAALDTMALGTGPRDTRVVITCALPMPLEWLRAAGLGRDRLAGAVFDGERVVARVERVYARRILETREEVPTGALAREAIRERFLAGALFPDALVVARDRLEAAALHRRLAGEPPGPDLETWVRERLEALGVESGEDVALLSPDDLLPPDLPPDERRRLDQSFPRSLELGDATYRLEYDPARREVTLHKVAGRRRALPPIAFLPPLRGFRVLVRDGNAVRVLRDR